MSTHTVTSWHVVNRHDVFQVFAQDGLVPLATSNDAAVAQAIVDEHNAHEKLVTALKDLLHGETNPDTEPDRWDLIFAAHRILAEVQS